MILGTPRRLCQSLPEVAVHADVLNLSRTRAATSFHSRSPLSSMRIWSCCQPWKKVRLLKPPPPASDEKHAEIWQWRCAWSSRLQRQTIRWTERDAVKDRSRALPDVCAPAHLPAAETLNFRQGQKIACSGPVNAFPPNTSRRAVLAQTPATGRAARSARMKLCCLDQCPHGEKRWVMAARALTLANLRPRRRDRRRGRRVRRAATPPSAPGLEPDTLRPGDPQQVPHRVGSWARWRRTQSASSAAGALGFAGSCLQQWNGNSHGVRSGAAGM